MGGGGGGAGVVAVWWRWKGRGVCGGGEGESHVQRSGKVCALLFGVSFASLSSPRGFMKSVKTHLCQKRQRSLITRGRSPCRSSQYVVTGPIKHRGERCAVTQQPEGRQTLLGITGPSASWAQTARARRVVLIPSDSLREPSSFLTGILTVGAVLLFVQNFPATYSCMMARSVPLTSSNKVWTKRLPSFLLQRAMPHFYM